MNDDESNHNDNNNAASELELQQYEDKLLNKFKL